MTMVNGSSMATSRAGMPVAGDALFVVRADVPIAASLGAVSESGDGRMRIPTPLPEEINAAVFARWTTIEAKIRWVSEMLENVIGLPFDASDLASFLMTLSERGGHGADDDRGYAPLFVPRGDMDKVRGMRGVRWDRRRRQYLADRTADYARVFEYLTPRAFHAWAIDRHGEAATQAMVKSLAIEAARVASPSAAKGDAGQVERASLEADLVRAMESGTTSSTGG